MTNITPNSSTVTPPPLPPSGGGDESKLSDEEYLKRLPVGYRFRPTKQELIFEYLMKKINNEVLPRSMIHTVKLYAFTPDQLAEMFKPSGEQEWYFFTPRDKKYKNGRRPNRTAGGGHWKATGAEKHIIQHNGEIIGLCQMLTYNKSLEKNSKTDWLMHEYKVRNSYTIQVNTMRLDDWVLCKVYKKTSSSSTTDDVVNKNVTQKKTRSRRKEKHNTEVKDGEVNKNSEAMESSNAISCPRSSSVGVAPLPFPYNMLRLGLSFEPSSDPTQNRVGSLNIYDELKHGEGTNKVAKQIHVASSHSIPTSNCFSSFGVGQFSLPLHYQRVPSHYQQVPSFAYAESINGTITHSSHFQVSEEAPNWTEDTDLYINVSDSVICSLSYSPINYCVS
ncbi:hypothetical protein C2S53_001103 [Perilla frutescens var. hirtella]|uniref:NAC domain-containing protein n=1 Tax=Perilla frutescens var. hirtella TaxID=608512 RepID=A0AAD4NYC5_PERFH|nr:hypothetical protein C2S53_001103 [Perilla frutescens var. hirtella]